MYIARTFPSQVGLLLALVLALVAVAVPARAHEDREIGEFDVKVGFLHEPAFEAQPNGAFIKITEPAIDLASHGALFSSGTVSAGGNFEFQFGERLEGLVVPYHDHLTGERGTVKVEHGAPLSGTVMVEFDNGFAPAELLVEPGTTVMFMNISSDSVMTVLSGQHDEGDGHSHDDGSGHVEGKGLTGLSDTLQVEVTHVPTGSRATMPLRPLVDDTGGYLADFIPTAPGAYTFRFFGEVAGEPFDETFTSGPNTFDEVIPARSVQFPIELREIRELQGALEGVQGELMTTGLQADDADSAAGAALLIAIIGVVAGIAGLAVGSYGLILARRKE